MCVCVCAMRRKKAAMPGARFAQRGYLGSRAEGRATNRII